MLEHGIHAADFGAGTLGDTVLAATVENLRLFPFFRGHGTEDGFHVYELLLVNLVERELVQARDEPEDVLDAAELLDGAELRQEVVQVEGVVEDLLFEVFRVFLVDDLLGFFHEGDHVAHAEDSACHAVGVEKVDVGEFFAHTDKADGYARHFLDGEGRTAAGVTVHLREAHARKREALPEGLGDVHGFLTDHCVGDEQDFVGVDGFLRLLEFLHQFFVNLQAARGIVDDEVETVVLRVLVTVLDDFHRVALAFVVHRNADGLAEHLQLLDSRRTVHVRCDEERFTLLFAAHPKGDLAREGRLTGTLEARHHDAYRRRAGEVDFLRFATHDGDEFVVDYLDDLLTGGHGIEHFASEGLFLDGLYEVTGHVEVYVGFEERAAHFAQRFGDVFFGELALPAQVLESRF